MPTTSSSTARHTREFPNPVAIFDDRFIFTVLDTKQVLAHGKIPYGHPNTGRGCLLFSLDEEMRYTSFAMDHGPLNLAFTYQACLRIHERLEKTEAKKKPLCLYTSSDPKMKSNMTLAVALWSLIVAKHTPWQAFRPIAQFQVMPFRDAGNGPMDYGLSIQDILYGVHKAMSYGLLDLSTFDVNVYQYFEAVDNGDLNILGSFIPFASPIENTWMKAARKGHKSATSPRGTITTHTASSIEKARDVSHALTCVLKVFENEKVGLVVRLNDELYDRRHFLDMGIDHVEMYFDDGSNPSDEIVREFIRLAEETIEGKGQKVAVHCKAGLGRTGVLIGAYLIYKYQFTAQEAIGYMRIVRPGMVVGPQQQYMVMKQMVWAGWAARDQALKELGKPASQEQLNPLATPPTETNAVLPSSHHSKHVSSSSLVIKDTFFQLQSEAISATRSRRSSLQKAGDAIGQPRKTPARPRHHAHHDEHQDVPSLEVPAFDMTVEPASPIEISGMDAVAQGGQSLHSSTTDETSSAPVTTESSSQGSMRGIKRAARRSPLLVTPERTTRSSLPRVSLSVPAPSLSRSSSIASMSSTSSADHDPRPSKRRSATSSPLAKNGLSSPPPSRAESPVSQPNSDNIEVEEIDEVDQLAAPTRLRIATRLRRRIVSPTPTPEQTDVLPSTPSRISVTPTPQEAPLNATKVLSPPKRSFLPVRRTIASAQFMDPKTISFPKQEIDRHAKTPIARPPSALLKASTPRRAATASSTPKKGISTPPRITGMWGQLAKLGSSSPATGCS
nr:uncharacterized protein CI109_002462 [Kwoniella shandongensis]KAA5529121.1 hypothetical protein CI109_002462 [Kwoniella shandongensis]